ncbi:MBL fold metallo-hydrolase [Priestia sp. SB1]|uniref:MBL fold metallo-hydrolase n=1 Tax=Priestia sp. SB1 TaxID=3132359 RepID=UPI003177F9E6
MKNSIQFLDIKAAFEKGFKNNGFFRRGDELFLIDLSGENFAGMRDKGFFEGVSQVHCIITHTHGDHVGGIGDLALYSFFSMAPGFSKKLKVYAPTPILDDVKNLLRILGTNDMHSDVIGLDLRKATNVGGVEFEPFLVEHVEWLKCFAFEIRFEDNFIYYSGDSNMVPEVVVEKQLKGEYTEFYQDTCIADYPGNVHLHLNLLEGLIPDGSRDNVFVMHLDNGFPLEKAEKLGFKLPKLSGMDY